MQLMNLHQNDRQLDCLCVLIIKTNWFELSLVVKASAIKQQKNQNFVRKFAMYKS